MFDISTFDEGTFDVGAPFVAPVIPIPPPLQTVALDAAYGSADVTRFSKIVSVADIQRNNSLGVFIGGTFSFPAASIIESTSTVAALPAAGTAGKRAVVTDATVFTFGTIVIGGGADTVPVYDDGTNWRIG